MKNEGVKFGCGLKLLFVPVIEFNLRFQMRNEVEKFACGL